ncbi:sirohydrochlorin chelatase [Baaleninema simplex]|uniref:sirohydrochlorin chelatase n=1 Tax=Baaleninema simplex TaxID=2862350 RepID=UPI0008FBEF14|nr:sirohydrochlorin chelatase [Baaleninema simplex]
MSLSDTYVLVSHGSHDRRPGEEMRRLATLLSAKIPAATIETAVLECHPQPLHRQLLEILDRSPHSSGVLYLVPLFLLRGVHVKEDIPEEVDSVRRQLRDTWSIRVLPHIGDRPEMLSVLRRPMAAVEAIEAWVVVSHGSRRPGGNDAVDRMAHQLQQRLEMPVSPAYWSVSPDLDAQMSDLLETGVRSIGVFPYFLFSGGLTDAIADRLQHWRDRFPEIRLSLASPIGTTPDFVEVVSHLISTATSAIASTSSP